MAKRGKLIAFEGIDGTGKSTQIKALAKAFENSGVKVLTRREPTTDGEFGMALRESATGERFPVEKEAEYFLKDRKWNAEDFTIPAMNRGEWVFLDRYYLSSMAYQGARGMDPLEIQKRNEAIAPRPDLVFMFELPLEESLKRINANRHGGADAFEDVEMLERVKEIFDSMDWPEIKRVDASKSEAEITEYLIQIIENTYPEILVSKTEDAK